MPSATDRPWRLGIIGLGVAGRNAADAAGKLKPRIALTWVGDPDAGVRNSWSNTDGVRVTDQAEDICAADDVDVVYVASPTALHVEHAELAASNGKHVMIEKPIATSTADCARIVEVGRSHGVHVMAVHTPSFEAPLRTARMVIQSGDVGQPLHLTQLKYVPWLERPRLAHEYDNDAGGGVINRQAPHQVDTAMYLLGGHPTSVHATSGSHPRWPGTDGHYTAMVTFSNGAVATLIFNGYGYFGSSTLNGGVGEDGRQELPGSGQRLRQLRGADKNDMRSGRIHEVEHGYSGPGPLFAPMSGWNLMSCENADIIQSPTSVIVHRPDSTVELPFLTSDGFLAEAFDELDTAVETGSSPLHDAEWGRRIVDVVAAIRESAASGRIATIS
jgi:phthalate 4,5-cis-dihydrodiol dehydrogenase